MALITNISAYGLTLLDNTGAVYNLTAGANVTIANSSLDFSDFSEFLEKGLITISGWSPTTPVISLSTERLAVVTTYYCKTAFTGASVNDTITSTQIIDVSSTPTTVSVIWRNQTTSTDFVSVPSAVNLTLDGSTAVSDAQMRASPIPVSVSGVATAANQTTANTSLATLVTNSPTLGAKTGAGSVPVVLASDTTLPLPTGASTAANQTTTNTSLATLVTNSPTLGAKTGAGSTPVVLASDTTLPLPTGAATAANQATEISSLATLVTNSPTLGAKTAAGSIPVTLSTDGAFVTNFGVQADTAASSDTGSFSLIAFIKRGLQNWTSLLAKLPASLGVKTGANSLPVVLASDSSPLPIFGMVRDSTFVYTLNPDELPQVLTYAGPGGVNDTTTVGPDSLGHTFKQTFTFTGSNITGISAWVKQ